MNKSVSASVSLTVEDIEFLAAYAESHGLASASAAASEDATAWDTTAGDGLG